MAKAEASQVDARDTDRHREDVAVLGQVALNAGQFRTMARLANRKDRRRIRRALDDMPPTHVAWRLINNQAEVRAALVRLSEAKGG